MAVLDGINPDEADNLKKIQLNLLGSIHEICLENSLSYYMIGGTLIGAVRHGGQIPWDDDIDIGMPRDDYEILREIVNSKHGSELFFQDATTEARFPLPFGKVRKRGSAYHDRFSLPYDIHRGIFVDVFPLDRLCGGGKTEFWIRHGVVQLVLKILHGIQRNDHVDGSAKYWIGQQLDFVELLKKIQIVAMTAMARSNGKYLVNYFPRTFRQAKREIMPVEVFGGGTTLQFEGSWFRAPDQYSVYLQRVFGDYMRVPDETERTGHGPAKVFVRFDESAQPGSPW